MKKRINEVGGYDDPTNKKITQNTIGINFTEALNELMNGTIKLRELISTMKSEYELRNKLVESADIIGEEIEKLNQIHTDFGIQANEQPVTAEDALRNSMKYNPNEISLNESTQHKIEQTINRIIEVNKKLNQNGTKRNK